MEAGRVSGGCKGVRGQVCLRGRVMARVRFGLGGRGGVQAVGGASTSCFSRY